MNTGAQENLNDYLVFAKEDEKTTDKTGPGGQKNLWKILIADDEEDVHEITRITLRDFSFENKGLELFSAYCGQDVKSILEKEPDIALILLDVVMEKDDTGLLLVEYIRGELKNSSVRIVLRTGQPGKAPEYDVITKYDINDYKTKPEMTARKLFTTVTSCLRAYKNIRVTEKNSEGLESIIRSAGKVFKTLSFSKFASNVLVHLFDVLHLNPASDVDSAYFIETPMGGASLMAGTGRFSKRTGSLLDESMPGALIENYRKFKKTGGETFLDDEYIGVFKTKEGFGSTLYLNRCSELSGIEKKLLRIYANNIAIIFDNISLAQEIINTQKEVILTLGEVVETRSQETAHHVTRVAEVCYLLAQKYGMDQEKCELLRLASPMHDVGKIGVPEVILNKPGRLDDDEFKIIQHHAQTGYEILRKSNRSIMKAAAIVALQHHERWDGKGYPQGLEKENIHIFGRIAAIADVFDALGQKRCYKEAWPMDRIIHLFKSESGKQFDPGLMDIFLLHQDEFMEINRRFSE